MLPSVPLGNIAPKIFLLFPAFLSQNKAKGSGSNIETIFPEGIEGRMQKIQQIRAKTAKSNLNINLKILVTVEIGIK